MCFFGTANFWNLGKKLRKWSTIICVVKYWLFLGSNHKQIFFYENFLNRGGGGAHSGRGGHIIKNAKLRMKPLKTQAGSPKLRPCCKKSWGIKTFLTIIQLKVKFIWLLVCSAICSGLLELRWQVKDLLKYVYLCLWIFFFWKQHFFLSHIPPFNNCALKCMY